MTLTLGPYFKNTITFIRKRNIGWTSCVAYDYFSVKRQNRAMSVRKLKGVISYKANIEMQTNLYLIISQPTYPCYKQI